MIYKILTEDNVDSLEGSVNDLIETGWKPIGGVTVIQWETDHERCWEYSQAMIKEEE